MASARNGRQLKVSGVLGGKKAAVLVPEA